MRNLLYSSGNSGFFCRRIALIVALAVVVAEDATNLLAAGDEAANFETVIAPLLARHCLECHSPASKKGGLDLTQQKTARVGGDSGAAIVPRKAEESLVWQYVESDEMPKKRLPLSKGEKEALRKWIDSGAAWGKGAINPLAYSSSRRAGLDWWSLQPVVRASPPTVKDSTWPVNDIDRFVLARLEASGLKPAVQADRRTLIRRLYFDLIGLPPEPEVVERFIKDESANAYENLVEELLQSPHYGERWARHWLDVVRYGETQGFERNKIRDNVWRYRDWVIQSLNNDLPYDVFVRQQIAGDVLYPGDLDAQLATGYHVCGTWDQVAHLLGTDMMQKAAFQDYIEDLVGTMGQTFLGLTINCSRCHDHKFDPISQQEYYQIAALLGGVNQEEKERSIAATRDRQKDAELTRLLSDANAQLARYESETREKYHDGTRQIAGLQLIYRFADPEAKSIEDQSQAGPSIPLKEGKQARFSTEGAPRRVIKAIKDSGELTLEAWITPGKEKQEGPARIATLSKDSGKRNVTLSQEGDHFEVRLRTTKKDQNGLPALASSSGSVKLEKTHVVFTFDQNGKERMWVNGQPAGERKSEGDLSNWDDGFRLGLGNELSGERGWEGEFHVVALYSRALTESEIRLNFETESRDIRALEPIDKLLARSSDGERTQFRELKNRRDGLIEDLGKVSYTGPAHVIAPRQPPVFRVLERGDFQKPQQVVAPAALTALSRAGLSADFGLKPEAVEAERRTKLAEWLTDRRNPLTARVFVNRLWHHHFGAGIVDTPSDFGFSGGRPSHPELLDYLASRFMDGGWKIKEMHWLIVTSATYRQASQVKNEQAREINVDNRLLWRFNAHRLEGEAVRDAVLAVSGALNRQIGGPSYRDIKVDGGVMGTNAEFSDPTGEFSEKVNRRTIYRLWARSGNNPMLESLDCPDPSVMSPRRMQTITPVQALSLLNNSFLEKCSERFAGRVEKEAATGDATAQIGRAYQLALLRFPSDRELELARQFVAQHGLRQFCLVLFNANEFLFVN